MDPDRRPIGYWLKQLNRLPPAPLRASGQVVKPVIDPRQRDGDAAKGETGPSGDDEVSGDA
jgi:hypothetical protein